MTDNALKTPLFLSLINAADRRANNFQQNAAQSIPCHVTKIDKDFTTVAFEPQNSIWTLPTIKIPVSNSRYVRDPTQVGDEGYAVPSNYNTETLTGLGGSYTNFFPKGNLTPLSFQAFSRTSNEERDYDQLTLTGGPNGVKIIQSSQKPKEDPPPGETNPSRQRRLQRMGSRSRAGWLKARTPLPAPRDIAGSIPKTIINIDQEGNQVISAIKGITHVADNIMPLSSMPASMSGIVHMAGGGITHLAGNVLGGAFPSLNLNGIVHMAEGGIAHVADAALGKVLPPQVQGILHLAEQAITHTSLSGNVTHSALNGLLNLVVGKQMNVGAPSSSDVEAFDATTPPQPTQPTIMNVIGQLMATTMSASGNISAGGMISAGGGFAGTGGAGAGGLGEYQDKVITTAVSATTTTPVNVATLSLTPGDWDVWGEVWCTGSVGATVLWGAISATSATIPSAPGTALSRATLAGITAQTNTYVLPLVPCRINNTTQNPMNVYLVGQATFASGTYSFMGIIRARRAS